MSISSIAVRRVSRDQVITEEAQGQLRFMIIRKADKETGTPELREAEDRMRAELHKNRKA